MAAGTSSVGGVGSAGESNQALEAVIASKLEPPRQRSALLARQGLLDAALRQLDKRLILVSAPAGYGKSSLLTQLHGKLKAAGKSVAWIGLDIADNDPVRFARHCLAALAGAGRVQPGPANDLLVNVGARYGLASGLSEGAAMGLLRKTFERLDVDTYVFLDDIHLVHAHSVHSLLSGVLHAALPLVHFVVASRQRPHWSLARMRAIEKLYEIEAANLAFDRSESGCVMQQVCAVALSGTQIDRIQQKTEGWPAGVQLVSLALRDEVDAELFLERFSGADRTVSEFLVDEVMLQQPDEMRRFLLGTSLLRRFSAAMVNDVLSITNAKALIDRAQDLNLFLFSLDRNGEWFRYHTLFADLLSTHLMGSEPELARTLHRRAGQWLAEQGQPTEAIDHALAAGELQQAGAWLDGASPRLFASGHTVTLQHYADMIPPAILGSLPRLQLEVVWEDILNWRFEKARLVLADIEARFDSLAAGSSALQDNMVALRARLTHRQIMMDVLQDDLDQTLKNARSWPGAGAGVDSFMDGSVETAELLARRELFDCQLIHGQWRAMRRHFLEIGAVYGTVYLDCVAGGAMLLRGELDLAEETLAQAVQTAIEIQGNGSQIAQMPSMQRAAVHYEANRLPQARELLAHPARQSAPFGLVDSTVARVVIGARLAAREGDFGAAHRELDFGAHIGERHQLPRLRAHVLAERVRLLIDEGIGQDARRLVKDIDETRSVFDTTHERLATARIRVLIEEGDFAGAVRLARRWTTWLSNRSAHLATVGMSMLAVKALLRAGDRLGAQRALVDALKRGGSRGIVRTVVDEGDEIRGLIMEFGQFAGEAKLIDPDYIHLLLSSYPSDPLEGQIEVQADLTSAALDLGLSPRELDVARLGASSFRTGEIARTLGMTESTIKWYWQKIFEKTGVRRRSMAIRLLRERGLLEKT